MKHDPNTSPLVREIREKLSKDLDSSLEVLLEEIHKDVATNANPQNAELRRTIAEFATFLGRLSIMADVQTRRIVRLTVALLVLTFLLFVLTIYLCQDAYQKSHHDQLPDQHDSQQAHPSV